MRILTHIGLWITATLFWGGCCGNQWAYDEANNTVEPVAPETRLLLRSGMSILSYPSGPWGYGISIVTQGEHAPNTKAFAISAPDTAGNPTDGFRIWGDARGEAFRPFTFHAPITVTEIRAQNKEVRWPDYVFSPTYKPMSLREIEAYARAYGHLPGLPSAQEVQEKGLPLVQTQAALLQKIEELTLHVIALQKQVDSLKALLSPRP
ncbi:MAG: hypothetical protein N3A68_07610 [Bacteroidia bacterium]|jgi:hypothetical protein|nr:hypothetical protein [Bacteroidia bacterium]